MQEFLRKISHFGTRTDFPEWKNRNIIVSNNISTIGFAIAALLCLVHSITHPGDPSTYVASLVAILFLSSPLINRLGWINLGRTALTITLLGGTLLITLARKQVEDGYVAEGTFFTSRAALLVFTIVPLAIFHFEEQKLLVINRLIGFLILFLYDPIHNLIGLGYYQTGHTDPDYYYNNFFFFIIYALLTAAVVFIKREMEKSETKNEGLINSLHSQNDLIAHQKEELESQGEVLKELLKEKDKDLSQVTHQMINFNHELLQYSYAVSHNLRGPVARILGLLDLYNKYSNDEEKKEIVQYIHESTCELDSIAGHLNEIVEARTDSFSVREKVNFEEEVKKIMVLLKGPITEHNVRIDMTFSIPEIFSVKQGINHILFILISNAIQYRHSNHPTRIQVQTRKEGNNIVIEVKDNGRGIDLEQHRSDLFKPFRYFHPDTSGKGVGLYLAKLQAQRLHGHIDVHSIPEKGSTFLVYLEDWSK